MEDLVVNNTPDDPELDYQLELVVKVRGFGKRRHRLYTARNVHKALVVSLHQADEDVEVYWRGERVLVDTVVDDNNEPPGYVPWYERSAELDQTTVPDVAGRDI